MVLNGITWKTVLAYAPVSNGRAARMAGTRKKAIPKNVLESGTESEKELSQMLNGYRGTLAEGRYPFELPYGAPPRLTSTEAMTSVQKPNDTHWELELKSFSSLGATRAIDTLTPGEVSDTPQTFSVANNVLATKGTTLRTVKWPAFSSKYHRPCIVTRASHPRYELISSRGRKTRTALCQLCLSILV